MKPAGGLEPGVNTEEPTKQPLHDQGWEGGLPIQGSGIGDAQFHPQLESGEGDAGWRPPERLINSNSIPKL